VDAGNPDVDVIEHAMLTMLEGGLVAAHTDTVYCLARRRHGTARRSSACNRLRGGADARAGRVRG
jgi:tRNA A37 threonylcarbamoyladenosine synthetase subunit TsaC/SUA5/YrdC